MTGGAMISEVIMTVGSLLKGSQNSLQHRIIGYGTAKINKKNITLAWIIILCKQYLTSKEDAMEKALGRISGKKSNIYSTGTLDAASGKSCRTCNGNTDAVV